MDSWLTPDQIDLDVETLDGSSPHVYPLSVASPITRWPCGSPLCNSRNKEDVQAEEKIVAGTVVLRCVAAAHDVC